MVNNYFSKKRSQTYNWYKCSVVRQFHSANCQFHLMYDFAQLIQEILLISVSIQTDMTFITEYYHLNWSVVVQSSISCCHETTIFGDGLRQKIANINVKMFVTNNFELILIILPSGAID